MTENNNPYIIQPTIQAGYEIVPFQLQERNKPQEGAIWKLQPGQSTKVQRIVHPEYQITTEAVNGTGFFLKITPDGEINIKLGDPRLGKDNPKITFGHQDIICFIASIDSDGEFAVEGKENIPFKASFEKEVSHGRTYKGGPGDYEKAEIFKYESGEMISLGSFWQAYHYILGSQSLDFIGKFYPQLQPDILKIS